MKELETVLWSSNFLGSSSEDLRKPPKSLPKVNLPLGILLDFLGRKTVERGLHLEDAQKADFLFFEF